MVSQRFVVPGRLDLLDAVLPFGSAQRFVFWSRVCILKDRTKHVVTRFQQRGVSTCRSAHVCPKLRNLSHELCRISEFQHDLRDLYPQS